MRALVYSWTVTLAFVTLYLGWTAASRYMARRQAEQPKPAVPLHPSLNHGSGLKILQFYPNAFEITRGASAMLCYGVANARSVRLEPPVADIQPRLNRCIEVRPERTTTYQLSAEGDEGQRASAACTIRVKPAPATRPARLGSG